MIGPLLENVMVQFKYSEMRPCESLFNNVILGTVDLLSYIWNKGEIRVLQLHGRCIASPSIKGMKWLN